MPLHPFQTRTCIPHRHPDDPRTAFPSTGTLILMRPDMMHLCVIIGISVTMLAMTSYLTYGYRVYHMSDMGQAINFWMQFTLLSRDPKCGGEAGCIYSRVSAWSLVRMREEHAIC